MGKFDGKLKETRVDMADYFVEIIRTILPPKMKN